MSTATKTRLDVVPLTRYIGAEIRGIDLRDKPDDETVKAIYQAWLDHLVIIFPGQQLSQEDLVRVTGYFGEQGMPRRPPKFFPKGYSSLLPGIMLISNIRENGEPIGALPDGEMMFHHDMIHSEQPDPAIRNKLEGRRAIHHYNYGSVVKGDNKGTEAFGECLHPVFRAPDDTGKKAVYVNRLMTVGIVDMPAQESDPLLNAVFDHSAKRDFVYEHVWRVGDLLLWDNRCSSHARTDFPTNERRLML